MTRIWGVFDGATVLVESPEDLPEPDGHPLVPGEVGRFPIGSGALQYRKIALVKAVKMPVDFQVDTTEGVMMGSAGDYLCQGPAGEAWPIKADIFEATYVRAGPDDG